MSEFPGLESEVEVAEGVFKRLADCTAPDLEGAAKVARQRAELGQRLAALMSAITGGMQGAGRETVAFPADLAERMRSGEELGLGELRTLVAELEQASLAAFD